MARSALRSTISLTGPFFTNDPAKTFRANARSMLRQMAIQGQVDIHEQLRVGEAGRAPISAGVTPARVGDHVRAGIPFTADRSPHGAIQVSVYVPNRGFSQKQGRALMAAYSRVEGETHAFRRTTARLRKSRALNTGELLKGIS